MNIGFETIAIDGYSGIETYARNLIRALAETDSDIMLRLFTSYKRIPRLEKVFGRQEKMIFDNYFPHPLILGKSFSKLVEKYKDQVLMRKAARKVDLFHCVNPCYYIDRIPNMVVTIHDIFPFYEYEWAKEAFYPSKEIFCDRFNMAFAEARLLFVLSNHVKEEVLTHFPNIKPERIHVSPIGGDPAFKIVDVDYNILRKYDIQPEDRYFLFVSRLDPRKNLSKIMQAFAKIPENERKDLKLICVGNGKKEDIEKFENKAKSLGISDKYYLLKGVSNQELVHIYNRALALVFVSYMEGFGSPLLEAMQTGCPIITSNVSSMPEIAGYAGLLVDPFSVESINEGMRKIVNDEQFRLELREKGLKRAGEFSWHRHALDTIEGYKKALNN